MKTAIIIIAVFFIYGFAFVANSKIIGYEFVVKSFNNNLKKISVSITLSDQRPASWDCFLV